MIAILEYGADVIQDIINQYVVHSIDKGEKVSVTASLATTLAEHGMGKLMSPKFLKKAIKQAEDNMRTAKKRLNNLINR